MAWNKHKAYCLMAAGIVLSACGNSSSYRSEKQSDNPIMNAAKLPMAEDGIVRLSRIQVYPEYLEEYLDYAVTVGETSLRTEPGVLTMYAMQDKSDSCSITILESYSSQEAYRQHIASEHFQRYKQGTIHMVKSLELCDQTPLNPDSKLSNIIINNNKDSE